VKNVLGHAGQIAGKTKNVESVTGLFKGITGNQGGVKNVLSGVAVRNYLCLKVHIYYICIKLHEFIVYLTIYVPVK
jgi:hypothetical protein